MTAILTSIKGAAEMLDVKDTRVIMRLIREGKITAVKIGRQYKVNVDSVRVFAGYEGGHRGQRR